MTTVSVHDLTKTYGEGELCCRRRPARRTRCRSRRSRAHHGTVRQRQDHAAVDAGRHAPPHVWVDHHRRHRPRHRARTRLPPLRAHHFGFVFQDFNLLSALDALENVELACNLAGVRGSRRPHTRHRSPPAARARRTPALPSRPALGRREATVAIARALANDAPIILADEPTANLDSGHGHEIAATVARARHRRWAERRHRLHDDRLREIADRVLWLEDGRFRELAAMAVDRCAEWPSKRGRSLTPTWTVVRGGSAPTIAVTSSLLTPTGSGRDAGA